MIAGIYPLPAPDGSPDWSITTAGTFTGDWQVGLAGIASLACQLRFMYGTAGTWVRAILQSSLDQGSTAYDVAIVDFGTEARAVAMSIQQTAVDPVDESYDGEVEEGLILPVLGDRVRLVLVVAGTYQNTTLSGRILPA